MSNYTLNKHQATIDRKTEERTMSQDRQGLNPTKAPKKPRYTIEKFMSDLHLALKVDGITREEIYKKLRTSSDYQLSERQFEDTLKLIREALTGTQLALPKIPAKKRGKQQKASVTMRQVKSVVSTAARLNWAKPKRKKA